MIALGNDHGGLELKTAIMEYLDKKGIAYKDFGAYDTTSCDYVDYAVPVCESVVKGECEKGILVCGTGIGMSISANKIDGIRAALCGDCFSAKYTRMHNNSNVLCLGGRVTGPGLALEIVELFLNTEFESGGRHERRVEKTMALEKR